MRRTIPPALAVFLILLASYAFFWHTRDWNTASRLMLTYALVDRGTVRIDGLEHQTGDLARLGDHYYSDKLPGYPLLAAVPYAVLRWGFHVPPHPLGQKGMAYWPPDYWITLGTSGLLTAGTAVLLMWLARQLGCGPRASALIGLAYGLATPAYAYATLAYGHQASAFALLASFLLIWRRSRRFAAPRLAAAGFLAASAAVIELQLGPVSAILGLYVLAEVLRHRDPPTHVLAFGAGALIPTSALLAYNQVAFGSPWDMGYFHHVTFANVHTKRNPLGLQSPDWSKLGPLLWGRYRGLLVYAPILILAAPGWIALMVRRRWAPAIVSFLVCAAVLLVNLGYPEWTGGWSTGPRLLVPLIPFAMIPVAGLLAEPGRWGTSLKLAAAGLALLGGVEMLLFQGAGARIPNDIMSVEARHKVPLAEPLGDAVWPVWTGHPPPYMVVHDQLVVHDQRTSGFPCNLVSMAAPRAVKSLAPGWRFLQILPLVAFQVLSIAALAIRLGSDRNVVQMPFIEHK